MDLSLRSMVRVCVKLLDVNHQLDNLHFHLQQLSGTVGYHRNEFKNSTQGAKYCIPFYGRLEMKVRVSTPWKLNSKNEKVLRCLGAAARRWLFCLFVYLFNSESFNAAFPLVRVYSFVVCVQEREENWLPFELADSQTTKMSRGTT